ncbi:DUF6714 family protein [Bordetella bronchiseptica]|uniref:DUF6714 family protein n=1 Tax=Bordetella bronchiseptica TaxID=518 RepID=UPI003994D45B
MFIVTHRSACSLSRYQSLSPEQREAIVAFLPYVAVHGGDNAAGADKALERYWRMPRVS